MCNSIITLLDRFNTEDKCYKYMEQTIWTEGVQCPCGHKEHWQLRERQYKCKRCKKQFNVKTGTFLQGTKLPMRKWMIAIYLFTTTKKGKSSIYISKQIEVTQKTAWFMLQRIRMAMYKDMYKEKLKGEVEADEAIIYSPNKNKHYHKREKLAYGRHLSNQRAGVVGIVERGGRCILAHVPEFSEKFIHSTVYPNVKMDSIFYSDEYYAYNTLCGYNLKTVNHSAYKYVIEEKHTNTIEGVWGLLKRNLKGIYHQVSHKHLDLYLSEFAFHYNHREESNSDQFINLLKNSDISCTYKWLTR